MKNNQKGLTPIVVIVIIALLLGGYLLYQNQNKQIVITPETPTSTNDETATWQTYTNSNEGFSIKYPPDWKIFQPPYDRNQTNYIIGFSKPLKEVSSQETDPVIYGISVYVFDPKGATSADEYIDNKLKEFQNPALGGITLSKRIKYSVGGVEGVWTEGFPSRSGTIEIYVLKNGKIYEFVLDPYDDSIAEWRPEEFRSTFEKILNTVKFLDQNTTDTSNWKTFEDWHSSRFSFKYPDGWSLHSEVVSMWPDKSFRENLKDLPFESYSEKYITNNGKEILIRDVIDAGQGYGRVIEARIPYIENGYIWLTGRKEGLENRKAMSTEIDEFIKIVSTLKIKP